MGEVVKNYASFLVFGLFVVVSATGCNVGMQDTSASAETAEAEAEAAETAADLPPVEVVRLEQGPMEAMLRFSTNLEAEQSVGVYAQAARQVTQLLVEEGDRIRRGQVMIRLQDEEQRTELARVESQLRKAEREHERQKRLYSDELISEQAFSEATYDLEQLHLRLEDARRSLAFTAVKAPISGTVTRRMINLGDNVTMNQHLFDIVDFNSLVARIYVPEKELSRLELGLSTRIYAPALASEVHEGSVDRISPVVDPGTGTVKVTVRAPNRTGLRPGLYVDVELVVDTRDDAIRVPKRALVYDEDQIFVYRMAADGETVERVPVTARLETKDWLEPATGLDVGDELVIAGQAGLKDGAKVRRVEVS